MVNELGDSYHKTVETAKAMLNDFSDKIILPTDLAANVEDNRVDQQLMNFLSKRLFLILESIQLWRYQQQLNRLVQLF